LAGLVRSESKQRRGICPEGSEDSKCYSSLQCQQRWCQFFCVNTAFSMVRLNFTCWPRPLSSTLFICDFYHRYFDLLREDLRSVVIGNSGVSKSWFHWYILYCLVNKDKISNLEPNHLNSSDPPKVIVHQVGDSTMFFYSSCCGMVYSYRTSAEFYLDNLKPKHALYSVEPEALYIP